MKRFLQTLRILTYPFMALSWLWLLGMFFGLSFLASFTVENRTSETITITPVGTIGSAGKRGYLPTKLRWFPLLATPRAGGFQLQPDESMVIWYDMDDINFSEIYIETQQGGPFQVVTDPNPTANQYHSPLQSHYVIDDLSSLRQADPAVRTAAIAARRQWRILLFNLTLLIGPWLAYNLLTRSLRRYHQSSPTSGRHTPSSTTP